MSLKIWLPMNRDLRNQGLLNNTITNSGATYSSDGKLGGCYIFDGVDDSLAVGNLSTMVETDFSFACWFYKDEWGSKGYETIFGGPSGFELESKVSSTNSPVLKLYNWGGGSCTYELSKWNHIVFTRNSTETKLYLNGELKVTGSAGTIPNNNYFVGSWNSATQQNFKGKMCDVRIYDNCLSPMEIKQLSQGLVLHYPLNRNNFGQENILLNTGDLTQWITESGVTVVWDSAEQMYKLTDTHSGLSRWGIYQNFTVTPNTEYTLTIEGKRGEEATVVGIGTYEQTTTWPPSVINFTTTKTKYTYTFTSGSNHTVGRIYLAIVGNITPSEGWFNRPKLEKGSVATPWCPNSSDALATTMGLNSTIEYDCSGFCNNGTKTGIPIYTSDTPKYTVSTQFTGTQFITADSPSSEGATLALWVKTTSTSNAAIAVDYKSKLGFGFWSGVIIPSCNGNIKTTYATTNYTINQWNHIVVVRNSSSTLQLYINGVLQTNTASIQDYWSGGVIDGLSIAARPNGSSPVSCQLSDIRIYATALSADDVKSLYQNCATIDPDGTIRGQIRS